MANSYHSKISQLQGEPLSEEEFTLLIAPGFEQHSDSVISGLCYHFVM